MRILFSLLIAALLMSNASAVAFDEKFFQITDVQTRKKEFVRRMLPLIDQANADIEAERQIVDRFFREFNKVRRTELISSLLVDEIKALAKKYDTKSIVNERIFRLRVAPIPTSLVLTQAAIETGWGTSRFFRDGHNAFGQWTWGKDGLVPEGRDEGKTHKVRTFGSVQLSVNAYMLNLNTNAAYSSFRDLRHTLGASLNGLDATAKMDKYSQKGQKYVDLLREIMIDNRLLRYDFRK
jgi:Bax protein